MDFLKQLVKSYQDLRMNNCSFYIFAHKADLVETLYRHHKIKAIEDYLINELKTKFEIKIYTTSIAKKFFFKTYNKIAKILFELFPFDTNKFGIYRNENFENELRIILEYEILNLYTIENLFYDLNIKFKEGKFHLERLYELGFAKCFDNFKSFKLTDKTTIFKLGTEDLNKRIIKI